LAAMEFISISILGGIMDIKDLISTEKVQSICQELGIRDWTRLTETKIKLEEAGIIQAAVGSEALQIPVEKFQQGLEVELEHGLKFPDANVTNNHPILTGKIVLAHLKEMLDYYTRLKVAELEGDLFKVSKIGGAENLARIYKELAIARAALSEWEKSAFLTGSNMKALIISADYFEDSELLVPYYRLKEAGVEVVVSSLSHGVIKGKHGYEVVVDKTLDEADPDDYAILILPGGKAPALVRKEPKALEIARSFFTHSKPVAAICHGPQILISAGLLHGRHATCYKSVADELKEAGALYEDREVVVDGNLVTSRQPADLPAFMRETMKQLGL
jgi:protease I